MTWLDFTIELKSADSFSMMPEIWLPNLHVDDRIQLTRGGHSLGEITPRRRHGLIFRLAAMLVLFEVPETARRPRPPARAR